MKLPCSLTLLDRNLPSNSRKPNKPVKSTIAVCKHPKDEKHCLLVFNTKNVNGTKYEVNENIQKIHTKFLNEGKVTIQFKNPPHDFYVQATVVLLKSFLTIMRSILTGTSNPKDVKCTSMSVSVTAKPAPIKLVIRNRSDYPSKGFPQTLEHLTIQGIKRCGLDLGIMRLTKLKMLNISDNQISKIPEEFNLMKSLKVLDISKNDFHQSSLRDWSWLSGNLCESLNSLNMSHNKLQLLPASIIKLKNLNALDVSYNLLKEIPNGIGCLKNLKTFKINNNSIGKLPGSVRCLRLVQFDASQNKFCNQQTNEKELLKCVFTISLKEVAAEKVLRLGLKYNSAIIPATLVFYLDSDAKYCVCGKPSFKVFSYKCIDMFLSSIADEVIGNLAVKTDCFFCSQKCARIYNVTRVPLVR